MNFLLWDLGRHKLGMIIIKDNPFRILGIYTNATTKEIVANVGKIKAFQKVGKEIAFVSDLSSLLLPAPLRLEENVAMAQSHLTLPNEKLKYALFWFVKVTPFDDVALNHLATGNISNAIAIWDRKECFSSLLNKSVSALIQDNICLSVTSMIKLLHNDIYRDEFITAIVGDIHQVTKMELVKAYFDILLMEKREECFSILEYINIPKYNQYLKDKILDPILSFINEKIEKANVIPSNKIREKYKMGIELAFSNEMKSQLEQLNRILPFDDRERQIIMDKLALAILQCGIDYFNGSEAQDAASKAMTLQKYALSIAIGKMAKDRCKENVEILQKIINDLPPMGVWDEDRAIKKVLALYNGVSNKMVCARGILNDCKPHLLSIAKKIGRSDTYYIKTSTMVVNHALYYLIEEVNNKVQNENLGFSISNNERINTILHDTLEIMDLMNSFDMDSNFRDKRYNPNRKTLKKMYSQILPSPNGTDGCMTILFFLIIIIVTILI